MILITKDLNVYDTETYGLETMIYGSSCQRHIEKKRKNWYLTTYHFETEYSEAFTSEAKLDVVYELDDYDKALKVLESVKNEIIKNQKKFNFFTRGNQK